MEDSALRDLYARHFIQVQPLCAELNIGGLQ